MTTAEIVDELRRLIKQAEACRANTPRAQYSKEALLNSLEESRKRAISLWNAMPKE